MKRGILISTAVLIFCVTINSQTGNFTYQGKLTDGAVNANGTYQMRFSLYDAVSDGSQIGPAITLDPVSVTGGIFTVELNFTDPEAFDGSPRWLEIAVKRPSDPEFTTLSPRQPITSAPYAIKSLNADTAETAVNSTQLGGLEANQFVITNDPRMSDARPPLAGSADYIQNRTTQQALSDFNVSGTGTANIFNAGTQFNLGGSRILSGAGNQNLFTGQNAGIVNTGFGNAFFGFGAGQPNTSGSVNSFFGSGAGVSNSTGSENSFFGYAAGSSNTTGCCNSFFGRSTGSQNTTGQINTFLGGGAGFANTIGSNNTFVGGRAGESNVGGSNNTTLGFNANVISPNLSFATAIGAGSVVSSSNTIALGRPDGSDTVQVPGNLDVTGLITGTFSGTIETANNALNLGGVPANQYVQTTDSRLSDARTPLPNSPSYIQNSTSQQASSNFNVSGSGTAGIFNALTQFDIGGNRILSNAGSLNLFAGRNAGSANTGFGNAFFGHDAGNLNQNGVSNTFVGHVAGLNNVAGSFNAFFGAGAGLNNTASENSFFGYRAGANTRTFGGQNSFFGKFAGENNTEGFGNSFFGMNAGRTNTTGNYNTVYGFNANVSAGDLTNANAIGSRAFVSQSNSLVLGSISDVNGCSSGAPTLCQTVRVGIGISAPSYRLHIIDRFNAGLRVQTDEVGGTVASFGGNGAFEIDEPGFAGGRFRVAENGDVSIGRPFAGGNLTVNGNTLLNTLTISNALTLNVLAAAGSTQLCRNAFQQVGSCSSSMRYKENINPFGSGIDLLNRLRPVTFNWTTDHREDLGLVAEEVEDVDPRLVTYNSEGAVEGVKYDRIGVVLINVVKEQQDQIDAQKKMIEAQQRQITALKALLCAVNAEADICNPKE
ncbi:MAG TPA: tail fiber domain-containing protein [Pyrinomonadaceae bacterium]|nr:tail fiber domain-containing protein [Pyrinomonadaceae bacterium]HMP66162.1 tail fiber domain-containing protein [Pyrinomonadaceae bacterium]